ncbi:MAG: OmpA family protein [Proteobacteria bacterium]|nr:OmpA family protein [Pseudomonadota bacterium]
MFKKFVLCALALSVLTGCVTDAYTGERRTSDTAKGAGIGALGGAALGAGIGALTGGGKGALTGAAIGAGSGALVGGGIGLYMDNQNAELRQQLAGTGVSVTKNPDNSITLNMPGDVTFATGSAVITSNFYPVLDSVATVLKKYKNTTIMVAGHTDSTGGSATNNPLSQQRASAVATQLIASGVSGSRIQTAGYGSAYPIADNATVAGRAANRRVEIRIVGNQQ